MIDPVQPLVRKLSVRDTISPEEVRALAEAISKTETIGRDRTVSHQGERLSQSRLLVDGWMARVKMVDGGKRQITQFHLPGDFVDLPTFLLKVADDEVVSLTPCTVAFAPHARLKVITEQQPHLTRLLWLETVLEAAIHRHWMASQGRMTALEQVANRICELYARLESLGLAENRTFHMPLTQEELGDSCGLTSVHVNRMVQQLRGDGLLEWRYRTLTIHDWPGLVARGMFDPAYLSLEREPR